MKHFSLLFLSAIIFTNTSFAKDSNGKLGEVKFLGSLKNTRVESVCLESDFVDNKKCHQISISLLDCKVCHPLLIEQWEKTDISTYTLDESGALRLPVHGLNKKISKALDVLLVNGGSLDLNSNEFHALMDTLRFMNQFTSSQSKNVTISE